MPLKVTSGDLEDHFSQATVVRRPSPILLKIWHILATMRWLANAKWQVSHHKVNCRRGYVAPASGISCYQSSPASFIIHYSTVNQKRHTTLPPAIHNKRLLTTASRAVKFNIIAIIAHVQLFIAARRRASALGCMLYLYSRVALSQFASLTKRLNTISSCKQSCTTH